MNFLLINRFNYQKIKVFPENIISPAEPGFAAKLPYRITSGAFKEILKNPKWHTVLR